MLKSIKPKIRIVMNCRKTIDNIRRELKNYLQRHPLKSLVIGESGGIDSALCTVLASPVCNKLGIELIGRSITIETNKPDEISRGEKIGELFCTDFKSVDLTKSYVVLKDAIEETTEEDDYKRKLRRGNIKARMRMIYLYNLAQRHQGLVLSTDNYTEYLEGFWTLHGDVGDFGMIQELWKTEVYEIANWLVDNELQTPEEKQALAECINAVPTDGLGITNSDLDQLGVNSYEEADQILKEHLETGKHAASPVVIRHKNSSYKRENPYNIARNKFL